MVYDCSKECGKYYVQATIDNNDKETTVLSDDNWSFTINKKTQGVSIALDKASGSCDVDSIINFSVVSATGFDNSTINYSAVSENTSIASVEQSSTTNSYTSYTVKGVSYGSTAITITAESANCKTSATFGVTVTNQETDDPNFTSDSTMLEEKAYKIWCLMMVLL